MILKTSNRRKQLLDILKNSDSPTSASFLAERFGVSRQVIVGDIAILRASGISITSTSKGYVFEYNDEEKKYPYEGVIAVCHTANQLADELYSIVDFGGTIINVTIDHPIYGTLVGNMDVSSRYEADLFIEKSEAVDNSALLSILTDGIHIHKIGTRDKKTFDLIKKVLVEKGIALS